MMKMSEPEQAVYVFVPGKNWQLSLAELGSYFTTRECRFRVTNLSKSFFVLESDRHLDPVIADELGGTLKISAVLSQIPIGMVKDAFLHKNRQAQSDVRSRLPSGDSVGEIFNLRQGKCVFGVSLYFDDSQFFRLSGEIHRFVGSHFKQELAAQGVRAKFMGFPRNRKFPQLTNVEIIKKRLVGESAEILLCIGREQAFIAKTVAVHNPFEFQKRDVERPVQRKIFSIPPRLAKMMVNLSSCLPERLLLDPFCGVGTILQEALLAKAHVTGMDIDPWCVEASRANLKWLKNEYRLKDASYRVLQGNARSLTTQIQEETVDCIATEPDLGPALRHFPTERYARGIVDKLKPMYIDFLAEAFRVLRREGRIVIVVPYIKTRTGSTVTLNIEEKALAIGFESVCPIRAEDFLECGPLIEKLAAASSFVDMEKRHKIGRRICVLQKGRSKN
jgi:tRNA G10  N-methylase Trm11